jgi:hypothetical protein
MRIVVNRILAALRTRLTLAELRWSNLTSRKRITSNEGVVISLTTYGARYKTVFLVIESIARGTSKGGRVILWLSDPEASMPIPRSLRALQARGLEILTSADLGPHKKYFPYLQMTKDRTVPLVTADDDVLYPRSWLEELLATHAEYPDDISCHRAHVVSIREGAFEAYSSWGPCTTATPSYRNFATGVSGVLYPPKFQDCAARAGLGFLSQAPMQDDIWLHHLAVVNGFHVVQVGNQPKDFPVLPGAAVEALYLNNVALGGNDRHIAATYSEGAIATLIAADQSR